MFGLGMSEIVLILVIALLVIGPKKLPEVAKALGKGYGEFKRAMSDFKDAVNIDLEEQDKKTDDKSKENLNDIYDNKWKDNIEEADSDDNLEKTTDNNDNEVETLEKETENKKPEQEV